MSNSVYYFSHDSNARNDERILMLRSKYKWEGYGIYWSLIEMMFENEETKLSHSKIEGISGAYNIDITLLKNIIDFCINEQLFESDNSCFWSNSLRRRKAKFYEAKEKLSRAGIKGMESRWGKPIDNIVITSKVNKVNKSKVIKEIKDKFLEFVFLTKEEHKKLIERFGEKKTEDWIETLNNGIGSKGYKFQSHYYTILAWDRKDKKKNSDSAGSRKIIIPAHLR